MGAAPGPSRRRTASRVPLLGLGMLALLGGLGGGLARLGWALPVVPSSLAVFHGPLMISGFLGTVIGLERAVAIGRPWAYLAPLSTGLGAVALVLGGAAGPGLVTLGSLGLCLVFVVILRRQVAVFTVTMTLGALLWLGGNVLWLAGWPVYRVVLWWAGFLVLTIAGERLELARLVRISQASRAVFVLLVAWLVAALVLTTAAFDLGVRLTGAGFLGLSLWLAGQDVARRTVRYPGLPRFTALCLLSGYAWLGLGGLLAVRFGGIGAGAPYDAILHAVLLGFVMAMIFGHAPIIFPAVLGWPIPFRRAFYAHLVLLHASLAARVAGDLGGWPVGRQWGGLLNALAVLLFLASTVRALGTASRAPTPSPTPPRRTSWSASTPQG